MKKVLYILTLLLFAFTCSFAQVNSYLRGDIIHLTNTPKTSVVIIDGRLEIASDSLIAENKQLWIRGSVSSLAHRARAMAFETRLHATSTNDLLINLDLNASFFDHGHSPVYHVQLKSSGDIIPGLDTLYNLGHIDTAAGRHYQWRNIYSKRLISDYDLHLRSNTGELVFENIPGASTADSTYVKLPDGTVGLAPYGGGGGTNLGNSDLTQTDPTRTFTIGANSLTFNATGTSGAVIDTVKMHMSPDGHEITAHDNDGYSAGLVMSSQVAGILSGDPDGNTAQITTNSSLGQAFMQSVDPDGNTKRIFMDAQSSFNQGIEVRDDSHVGLIGHEVFPISDDKQYAQYGKVDSLIAAAGSTFNFTNGLNQDGADVRLGGTLTDPTNIDVSNHFLDFTSDGVANGSILEHDINDFGVTTTATDTATRNRFISTITGSAVGIGLDNLDNINRSLAFNIDSAKGFQLLDDRFKQGIKYTHFANWLSLKDSSLVPRKYAITLMDSVKATISGGVSSVFGRTGAVVAATNDYTFAQIGTKPTTLSGYGITDAYPLTGNPSSFLTGNQTITLSGDVSGSGTTTITTTIGAAKVTNAMLAGSIAASKLVGTDITTVGTLSAGSIPYSLLTGTPSALPPSGTAGGELAGTYPNPTLLNSAVIAKVLTGYSSSAGTVASTDNILQAIQKLNGNDGLKVPTSTTVAGFALSSNVSLAALTATDATLTFSGSYDGSTARTVGLNLANANTITSKWTWNNSVTASSALAIGQQFTPTLVAAANNDVLVGLNITPTYTAGAFTGVYKRPLRLDGEIYIGAVSTGHSNIVIGDKDAGHVITGVGANNTIVGAGSPGGGITTGTNNSLYGTGAAGNMSGGTSSNNTFIGGNSFQSASTGQSTTTVGASSGGGTGTITQGIAVGASTTFTNGSTNETVIGYSLTGNGSNTVTIGNSSVTNNYFKGTLNIAGLTASKVVFTDASKNLTSTGIGTSSQLIKGDGSLVTSTLPIHGNSTTTGTATTVVTVTIGQTMANTTYMANIAPQDLLTAVNWYISAKTTTTFDVTFISALTGSINFDWEVIP